MRDEYQILNKMLDDAFNHIIYLVLNPEQQNTLDQLLYEIESALRSAMSYCDCVTLGEFIGNVKICKQSINEFVQYEK